MNDIKPLLCVRGRDWSGEWSWCACADGKRDDTRWSQDTACGMHVTLPGYYATRVPDCPDCIAALELARGGDEGSDP